MEFDETEVTWQHDKGLMAVAYRPETGGAAVPCVVDVHGGAWSAGHRKSDRHYCRRLAAAGIAVLSIDFRHAPGFQHPAASEDIGEAVNWVKSGGLDIEIATLGLTGSSSGGHLVLLAGLKPEAGADVDFVVALWPVSNPLARYQYVKARATEDPDSWVNFQPLRLAEGHEGYFVTEANMQLASIQRILSEGEATHCPRVFVVQPELDQNVPVFMTQTLHGGLLQAGLDATYKLYPGVEHGFAQAEGPQTKQCIEDMIAFIKT